jgi:membrane fusion protein (multidrug efflux system)
LQPAAQGRRKQAVPRRSAVASPEVRHGARSAPRRRRWLWPVIGIAIVAVVAGASSWPQQPGERQQKKDKRTRFPPPRSSYRPWARSTSTFLETTTVPGGQQRHARRPPPGSVIALLADEGQSVAKGQTLARLDDTEARIALSRAKLALEQAERDATRGQALLERGVQAQVTMDELTFKLRTAKESVAQAEYDLAQTRIVAPFGGKVVGASSSGETVTPGKDCFRVDDFDPCSPRLPDRDRRVVGRAALGLTPTDRSSPPGPIVNPMIDRSNGTFKVTLEVSDPSAVLRPGSFARVRLESASYADVVVLPRKAVVTEDGDSYVFVASGDSVNRVAVQLGAIAGDTAQILTGLEPGAKVVTVGQGGLKQGARIKPVAF